MDMPNGMGDPGSESRPNRFSYGGFEVDYDDSGGHDAPMMTIGGVDVMIRREETGGFSAPMLNMHATFGSLEELARNLIDTSPVFLARRYQRPAGEEGN
jgi:hypothetical protein